MQRNTLRAASFLVGLLIAIAIQTGFAQNTAKVVVGPFGTMTYSPSSITIFQGDTVEWTWQSPAHSVTSGTGTPTGEFDSGLHNSPFTFTHTFSSAGSFPYYCVFHGTAMSGLVNVLAPSPTPRISM